MLENHSVDGLGEETSAAEQTDGQHDLEERQQGQPQVAGQTLVGEDCQPAEEAGNCEEYAHRDFGIGSA